MKLICLLFFTAFACLTHGGDIPTSWSKAKQIIRDKVYFDHRITKYCGCSYEVKGVSGGVIDTSSCGYNGSEMKYQNAINVLDWEHVVPASLTPAKEMNCWVNGSRNICERTSKEAKAIIFDFHNLVPSIGQTNRIRSNSRYGIIEGEEQRLGLCDFEWSKGITEPSERIRGELARVWLYMSYRHNVVIPEDERLMFLRWSLSDPPDEWEYTRNARIKELQGNSNIFIDMFKY
ncbi:endonuclease [Pseudoalteromonas sp. NGC95]|uniref:endonuclease n=1 Tax=Pseudoalteromonas sp. NGC95 TaxID=2792051 RepID=UPI001E45C722|nr:endonuclease [Pseudoalteromonas sp. NGC95]